MTSLYKKIDSQLDELLSQMHELSTAKHIYYKVRDIVESNQELQVPSHFYAWMDNAYTTTMIAGIRRLVDSDTRQQGSISFITFLSEIRDAPHILSRSAYKNLYRSMESDLPEAFQDEEFDRLAGEGANQIDPVVIDNQLDKLKRVTKKLKRYVDKRIAHYDKAAPPPGPSYKDIDEAFDFLSELLSTYYQFFRANSISLGPYIQYDWMQIFRVVWIPKSDSFK